MRFFGRTLRILRVKGRSPSGKPIGEGWFHYLLLQERQAVERPEPIRGGQPVMVPDVSNLELAEAVQILNQRGLRAEPSGSGAVQRVEPSPGSEVSFGSVVHVHGSRG